MCICVPCIHTRVREVDFVDCAFVWYMDFATILLRLVCNKCVLTARLAYICELITFHRCIILFANMFECIITVGVSTIFSFELKYELIHASFYFVL